MFTLRSCCSYRLAHPTLILISLSKPKTSFFKNISFSNPNPNPNAMSSRPSAFDALMANAKAAASKKKQTQPSSPKKRKTLESNSPIKKSDYAQIAKSNLIENTPNQEQPKPTPSPENVAKKQKLITADESILELKKKAANFDPKRAAFWGDGERVPFLFLAKVFDAISKESGRIAITEIVCNMLRTVISTTPNDLTAIVYLLANRIAPAHEGLELGIGDASIIKALAAACGATEAQIKKQYKELGDLGLVAKASRSSQPLMRKLEALTVAKVFDTFRLIAKESGKDSQDKKKNHIRSLLVAATDCEPQYLIRLLQTKLRIGLAEQTLLTALGHAAVHTEKHSKPPKHVDSPLEEEAKIVKQVYSVIPVYDKIIPAILSGGVWNLPETCSFSPGVPVGPMLAKPTKGVSEIVDKFQGNSHVNTNTTANVPRYIIWRMVQLKYTVVMLSEILESFLMLLLLFRD